MGNVVSNLTTRWPPVGWYGFRLNKAHLTSISTILSGSAPAAVLLLLCCSANMLLFCHYATALVLLLCQYAVPLLLLLCYCHSAVPLLLLLLLPFATVAATLPYAAALLLLLRTSSTEVILLTFMLDYVWLLWDFHVFLWNCILSVKYVWSRSSSQINTQNILLAVIIYFIKPF